MSAVHAGTWLGDLSAPLSITNTISAQFLLALTINNNIMNLFPHCERKFAWYVYHRTRNDKNCTNVTLDYSNKILILIIIIIIQIVK